MTAPLVLNDVLSQDYSLLYALVIGIGMGFFLERAGFGSALKLIGQFYLYDMTVFKVMFTAVITAMTGIYLTSKTGFLDLEQVSLIGTYVWPQVLGGLMAGAGFIVGGYCPGTSAVAAATGKLDGMMYVAGLVFGMVIFGELSPHLQTFLNSGNLGKQTLYSYFGIPFGLVVVLVLAMAGGGFVGATWVEKRFSSWRPKN